MTMSRDPMDSGMRMFAMSVSSNDSLDKRSFFRSFDLKLDVFGVYRLSSPHVDLSCDYVSSIVEGLVCLDDEPSIGEGGSRINVVTHFGIFMF